MPRQLTIGRLTATTVRNDLVETLGDGLDAAGAVLVPAERRARPFKLTVPLHGEPAEDTDPYAAGERLRRQWRAALQNPLWTALAHRLVLGFDDDVDGWIVVGGGDLKYDRGGVVLADYLLELDDAYRVASTRTHRPGWRHESAPVIAGANPRDILGRVFSTDFASVPAASPSIWVPGSGASSPAAYDATGRPRISGTSAPLVAPSTARVWLFSSLTEGDVLTTTPLPATSLGIGDVTIHDRQNDLVNETAWEEVFGPDQALTAGDVPVLSNQRVRVRWVAARSAFALDYATPGAPPVWAEFGRVTIHDSVAGVRTQQTTLTDVRVVAITPERGVISCRLSASAGNELRLFISIDRGEPGVRFETYKLFSGDTEIMVSPVTDPGDWTLVRQSGSTAVTGTGSVDQGAFTAAGNWAYLNYPAIADIGVAAMQQAMRTITVGDSTAYGASRRSASFRVAHATTLRYASLLVTGPPDIDTARVTADGARHLQQPRQIPVVVAR